MRRVEVALGDRSYPILIGSGLLREAGTHLAPFARRNRLVVVSDENVWSALGESFTAGLGRASVEAYPIILPPGERSKNWETLRSLVDRLIDLGVERRDHIVALGGGVVGDVAGFASAIVKRGCSYVQIPTSLLAQVDSSVGGKTAINTEAGKNLVGAFRQPATVLIDPDALDSVPERELRAGYAEVVKYGLIGDAGFFAWCEANGEALLAGDAEARLYATETCVRAKADIVSEDERETGGRRALLNFGHSFGHAIEAEGGFSDLLHGEAVAIGMVLATRFSAERGLCSEEDAERVAVHLGSAGLPTRLPSFDPARLAARMASDKKNSEGQLTLVLMRGIGDTFVDRSTSIQQVEDFLRRQQA